MKTWPRRISIVLLLLCNFTFVACHKSRSAPQPLTVQPGQSFYVRQAGYRTVIVFVHGVFGDGRSTWTNPSNHAYWPELIKDDDKDQWFRKSDIFVYSYPSPFLKNSYSIDQVVEDMYGVFSHFKVFESHDEVVFICHSMGGIVVRGYLQVNQDQAQKVSLIYFYATPTNGASLANLASLLSGNPQLGGLRPVNENEYVQTLQRHWSHMHKITSRCAYETQKIKGLLIVDESSARNLCDDFVWPLPTDHIDIVKPIDREDKIYYSFQDAFDERQQNSIVYVAKSNIQAGQSMQCMSGQGQAICGPVTTAADTGAPSAPATTGQSQTPTAQPEQRAEVSQLPAIPTGGGEARNAPRAAAPTIQQAASPNATNVTANPAPNGIAPTNRYAGRTTGASR